MSESIRNLFLIRQNFCCILWLFLEYTGHLVQQCSMEICRRWGRTRGKLWRNL